MKLPAAIFFIIFLCLLISIDSFAQNRAWGFNGNGELGLGTFGNNQPTPVNFTAVSDVTGIGGGSGHTLYLKSNGAVMASGSNLFGQLGNGTTNEQFSPVAVLNLANVIQVTAGSGHSAALLSDGTVKSWGRNFEGQLGNNSTTNSSLPVATLNLTNIVQIDAGQQHTLALKADGTVWSWGANGSGQLGDNSTTNRTVPVQVSGLSGIIAVSAGEVHSMALRNDGKVFVWGNNGFGQVGNGTVGGSPTMPILNINLSDVVQISAGGQHNMALLRDGSVRVWGYNVNGQVGNGTTSTNQPTPTSPLNVSDVIEIETGGGFATYVRQRDGSVKAWGRNDVGQVGDGTTVTPKTTPVNTLVGTANTDIAAGHSHAFVLKPSFTVSAGNNQIFQGSNLVINFDSITSGGNLSYSAIDPSIAAANYTLPSGYLVQTNQPAFDVTTTAAIAANSYIFLCIDNINEFNSTNFSFLKILHAEGANWVDRTFVSNFQQRQICARVTSLSPFITAQGLTPTAANVSVSGRVVIQGERLAGKAKIALTDSSGETKYALVNQFGYYKFDEVEAGQTYTVQAYAKGYTFSPQVIIPTEDITNLNFSAE